MREKVAVDASKSGWIGFMIEPWHLNHIHFVSIAWIGKRNLIGQVCDQSKGFQVAVELLDAGQGDLGQALHQVAHGHIVRKSHFVGHLDETTLGCMLPHFFCQMSTQAESSPSSCKPETDFFLKLNKIIYIYKINICIWEYYFYNCLRIDCPFWVQNCH